MAEPLDDMLSQLPETLRESARQLVDRLYKERALIDGIAPDAHTPARFRLSPTGSAAWAIGWQPVGAIMAPTLAHEANGHYEGETLPVLCQDRLDYDEALNFNRRCLWRNTSWLWASTGAMSHAYISPLFLSDAGPCLGCLLNHFRRLSPVPELYNDLAAHTQAGRPIAPVSVPPPAAAIVQQLIVWKAALAESTEAPAALYRLHVLEMSSLEVTSHRVLIDPECPECGGRN